MGTKNITKFIRSDFYVRVMTFATIFFALGLNFLILQPAFPIFNTPNWIWGSIFIILSAAYVFAVNIWYRPRLLKIGLLASVAYLLLLAVGTSQPFIDGMGSLQLPIMYIGLATLITILTVNPPEIDEPPEEI